MKYISKNQAETAALARTLYGEVLREGQGISAVIIGLSGELGAGKTAFAREFIKAAGVKERVVSPTFPIIRSFELKGGRKRFKKIYHIDAYRVETADLLKLGLKEIIGNWQNIALIEWADKIKSALPRNAIWIKIRHGKKINQRFFNVKFKNQKSK